jgi:flagellar biosynthetic protein FliP
LTYFVMAPVFQEAYAAGIAPLIDGLIAPEQAIPLAYAPFRVFMEARVDPDTLQGMMALRELPVDTTPDPSILIPSFMLSEVERAFQIGFLIFLPFLIIDLVVAAILMSMGMMMVPPAIVSLPFKLAFFVVADGWVLITGALVRSYF